MEYVGQQLSSCFVLLVAGMVLGFFFDFYRVFRGRAGLRAGRGLLGALADLVFWGLALILITPLIFWSTWMELRFFVWLLILAGLLLYFVLFSRAVLPLLVRFWTVALWVPGRVAIGISVFLGWMGRVLGRSGSLKKARGKRREA